jgi:putative oxidoreductase
VNRLVHWSGHAWLALPARLYLGCILICACLHKIAHPGSFALDIATYDILPLSLVNLMAVTLPWIELATGIMLIVGFRVRGASLVITGMMIMFIAALALALARGLNMSCGCFASQSVAEEDPISYLTILRDSTWLLLSVYIGFFDRNVIGLDRLLTAGRKTNA